jgi:hypothetical protein
VEDREASRCGVAQLEKDKEKMPEIEAQEEQGVHQGKKKTKEGKGGASVRGMRVKFLAPHQLCKLCITSANTS